MPAPEMRLRMTDKTSDALARFDAVLVDAKDAETIWRGLQDLADAVVGARLFTVMQLDWAREESVRAYTNHPQEYPVSGAKPINRTHWFETIHVERKPFVANTIKDIANVFPDHELIWSLGCGSVVNLPVFVGGQMLGTVNLLDAEHYYTPERVAAIVAQLSIPSKAAFLAVKAGSLAARA